MTKREDSATRLHADVDKKAGRLHLLHAKRLQCRRGCSDCCVDDLTVFDAEANQIRRRHPALLDAGVPHPRGGCAFLDAEGGCRIYEDRPYVCRTQGLPLRWVEESDAGLVELRDICPLNEAGPPLDGIAAKDCWTLGPIEERLGHLQLAAGTGTQRTFLRSLFLTPP